MRAVVVGIMGAYGIMKSIEWGLASNLLPYTWIGFDEPTFSEKSHDTASRDERRAVRHRHRDRLVELRARQAAEEGPIQILRSTVHLMLSMRGAGYQFGAIATKPYSEGRRRGPYLRRLLLDIALSHPLLVLCAMTLLEPPSNRDATLAALLPDRLTPVEVTRIGGAVTGLAMGTAVFAALTLGYSCAALLALIGTSISQSLPLVPDALRLPPFDPREYPPLFKLDRVPDSVAVWWSQTWHAFFARESFHLPLSAANRASLRRRLSSSSIFLDLGLEEDYCSSRRHGISLSGPFRFLGFKPAFRLVSPLAGKGAGRAAAVLATFAVSAWIHEFGKRALNES